MRVLSTLFGILLAILSVPALAGGNGLQVVDLTPEFDRFAMATESMPDHERLAAFERELGPHAEGFYARDRWNYRYDDRVLDALKTYPRQRAAIMAVSREFQASFDSARLSFEAVFGPVSSDQPVYLVDSLGEMDGGTRDLNGKSTLVFGADMIAEYHAGSDMTAFFHHELFHVYHAAKVTKCAALWCALWEEGLATYAASRLNPGADDAALSLDVPRPLRPAVEADRRAAICATEPLLDTTGYADYASLFVGGRSLPGFPARMGYYIGYLVAADVGRTHSLHEMADMSLVQARPLIDASLARMADCSTRSAAEARERSRTNRSRG